MAALIRPKTFDLVRNVQRSMRLASTSSKKNDTAVGTAKAEVSTDKPSDVIDFSIEGVRKSKQWVSYGFDLRNKEWDRQVMRGTMFTMVTVMLVCSGFVFAYAPEPHQSDWALREAYLRLREREAAGLNPIDADLVDPSTVVLPSDEELGDVELII